MRRIIMGSINGREYSMGKGSGILRDGIHQIPLDEIYAVEQVRLNFSPTKLQELADDMAASGQAQAIMVRPKPSDKGKYLIVFGERRVRAARINKWPTIRAEVADLTDLEAAQKQWAENQARVNLNPIDEAWAIKRRMDAEGWSSYALAAEKLGYKENTLRERVKLLALIEDMRDLIEQEKVGVSFGVEMQKLNPEMQQAAYRYLLKMPRFDIKAFKDYCHKLYMQQQQPSLLPLEEVEQGLPSVYTSGPSPQAVNAASPVTYLGNVSGPGQQPANAGEGSTESVPRFIKHPELPEIKRGRNVGAMLETYIEDLRNDPDIKKQEAARVVEHIYVELRAANKIKG